MEGTERERDCEERERFSGSLDEIIFLLRVIINNQKINKQKYTKINRNNLLELSYTNEITFWRAMEIDAVRLGTIEQATHRTKQTVWESKKGYDEVKLFVCFLHA